MMHDCESRQLRAVEALDALDCLLLGHGEGDEVPARMIGALVGVIADAVRAVMPATAEDSSD
jgi:hypothetical protein